MAAKRTKPKRGKRLDLNDGPDAVTTIVDLAKRYGVTTATVKSYWLHDPSFPGKPGKSTRAPGHFPIRAIAEWLLKRDSLRKQGPPSKAAAKAAEILGVPFESGTKADSSDKARKLRAEMRLAELKVQEREGMLVDRDIVRSVLQRHHSILIQTMRQLPNMLGEVLPHDLDVVIKADFVRRAEIQVEKVLASYAELMTMEFVKQT